MAEINEKAVKNYYDNNTKWFLRFGQKAQVTNIHQALWPEEVNHPKEAFNYVNELIYQHLVESPTLIKNVLDLGCGLGSSLIYLAHRIPEETQLNGVTISTRQQIQATKTLQDLDLNHRCQIYEASFLQLPPQIQRIDFAYAIEAFVHASDARRFFQEVARVLSPGGQLIIIDDFVNEKGKTNPKADRYLQIFRKGWMLGSLLSIEEIQAIAQEEGFLMANNQNLTPYLDLNRFRDKLLAWYVKIFRPILNSSTYFLSLSGGDARYQCLKKEWIDYRILTFTKRSA